MAQTILFLRNRTIFGTEAAAREGLNTVTHKVGQPIVALFGTAEAPHMLLAVGTKAATGASAYEVVANYKDLADLTQAVEALTNLISGSGEGSVAKKIEAAINTLHTQINKEHTEVVAKADGKVKVTVADSADKSHKVVTVTESDIASAADLTAEVTRAKAAEGANAKAVSDEATRAKAAEKANADAIEVLNGDETTEGSVAKSVKDAVDGLLGGGTADGLVSDVTKSTSKKDTLVVDYTKEGKADGEIFMNYDTAMPDTLTTPNAVGGVKAGITAAELKEKGVSAVLDMILFPELNPVVVNPSASIAFKGFTNGGIYEVGATAPAAATGFTTSLNRGNCTVAGQPNKNRAGELDSANSYVYYGNSVANQELPANVVLGQMQYNFHAAYGQGDELKTSYGNKALKDSKGAAITNPLAAGAVNSGAVSIYGTYPYFCNGASSSQTKDSNLPSAVAADTKLPLQKWTDTQVCTKFASEAATNTRAEFKFPATKKVTKVEIMNPLSGNWEPLAGGATSDAGNMQVQGTNVAYKKWTTTGALSGATQLRFTIANA